MKRRPFGILCRAFFARFFASESVTSDEQLRHAIVGVLAFILTPCLLILIEVFPQFQLLVIRVGRIHPPPGVVVRATAVRNINAQDMLEWTVSILVAYSMVTVGLIAVWTWDALSFDQRDAMVLGPLPVKRTTIVGAKLAALAAFLTGTALLVNLLNATVFALETSDQFGARALASHFAGCLIVATAAATFVFAAIVTVRGALAVLGGPRLAAFAGSGLQFLFVVASLVFLILIFVPPADAGAIAFPTLTLKPPTIWFVAWFEQLRGSERGAWDEFAALARRAWLAPAIATLAAVLTTAASVRRQLQFVLAPAATAGALGRAGISGAIARLFAGPHPAAEALADFILTTIARNRTQQAPIAVNAAVGAAFIVFSLTRERGDATTLLLAVPLVIAYWLGVGLRAAFFVPSELPASWTFHVCGARAPLLYWTAVRASTLGFLLPFSIAADAMLIPLVGLRTAALHGAVVVAVTVVVADAIAVTIDFIPFARPYRPGHAKLKTRWPMYLVGVWALAYGPAALARRALHDPIAMVELTAAITVAALVLEYLGRLRASRRSIDEVEERLDGASTAAVLDIGFILPGASRI